MHPKGESWPEHQQGADETPNQHQPPQPLVALPPGKKQCRAENDDFPERHNRNQKIETIVVEISRRSKQKIVLWTHPRPEHLRDVYPALLMKSWQKIKSCQCRTQNCRKCSVTENRQRTPRNRDANHEGCERIVHHHCGGKIS